MFSCPQLIMGAKLADDKAPILPQECSRRTHNRRWVRGMVQHHIGNDDVKTLIVADEGIRLSEDQRDVVEL